MISFYHLGVATNKNLSEFCKYLTDKGINNKIELEEEGVSLDLMYNNKSMKIMIKLYEKEDNSYIYELKFKNYEDFKFIHDIVMAM